MRKLLVGSGLAFLLLLLAIAIVPYLIPSHVYKSRIEQTLEQALDRNVELGGDVHLSVFPSISVNVGETTIDNPDQFGESKFAKMSELKASIKLLPLLSRTVEIDEFILVDPQVNLVRLASGEDSWTFQSSTPPEGAPSDEEQPNGGSTGGISAQLGDVRLVNGLVTFVDERNGQSHRLEDLNISVKMKSIEEPVSIEGSGIADEIGFKLDIALDSLATLTAGTPSSVEGSFSTDLASALLDGTVQIEETPVVDLTFETNIPSINALADAVKIEDLPLSAALGAIELKGMAVGPLDNLNVVVDTLTHRDGLFKAAGSGEIEIGDLIKPNLKLEISADDLQLLAREAQLELPALEALGKAQLSFSTTGDLNNLSIQTLTFEHDSRLLSFSLTEANASIKSMLETTPSIRFGGKIVAEAPDLKKLAELVGSTLPNGDVYRSALFQGAASGSLNEIKISDARVQFDDIDATGDLTVNLSDTVIDIDGQLRTGPIDATPYAVASNAVAETSSSRNQEEEWQSTPIDLGVLNTLEMDVSLITEALKFQVLEAGNTTILLKIKDGQLTADLEEMELYGGSGSARLTAVQTDGVPTLAFRAGLSDMSAQPFLSALADMNLIQGVGDLNINIEGSGTSMADLVSTLSGSANFNLIDGAVQGVDLERLKALTVESLATGAWSSVLSQDASTNVQNFSGSFSVQDGEAVSRGFVFKTGDFRIPGQLKLDLPGRSLSMSLSPIANDKSLGFNGEFPAILFNGPWGGKQSITLDQDWLQNKLQAAATQAVTDGVIEAIGGNSQEGQSIEDVARDRANDAFRDLLGLEKVSNDETGSDGSSSQEEAAVSEDMPTEADPSPSPSPTPETLEDFARERLNEEIGRIFD